MSKREKIYGIFEWLENRSIKEMRDIFNKAVEAEENKEWFDLYIDMEYNDDGDGESMAIVGLRLETDADMKKRLEQEKRLKKEDEKFKKQQKAKQEAQERKMYKALKKKFEGK
jgi:hypothetical protein